MLFGNLNLKYLHCRKIRNWIQEKKQENKNFNKHSNGRRHRHKSLGETPTNSSPLQPVPNSLKIKRQTPSFQVSEVRFQNRFLIVIFWKHFLQQYSNTVSKYFMYEK